MRSGVGWWLPMGAGRGASAGCRHWSCVSLNQWHHRRVERWGACTSHGLDQSFQGGAGHSDVVSGTDPFDLVGTADGPVFDDDLVSSTAHRNLQVVADVAEV